MTIKFIAPLIGVPYDSKFNSPHCPLLRLYAPQQLDPYRVGRVHLICPSLLHIPNIALV